MTIALAAAIQGACELVDPEYAQRRAEFDKWWAKWTRCLPPDGATQLAQTRAHAKSEYAGRTEAEKEELRRDCAKDSLEIGAMLRPTRAIYATPQATWQEFRAALVAKDRKRALECLSGSQSAEALKAFPDDYLPTLGKSLSDVQLTNHQAAEYSEAYAETVGPDGKKSGAIVLFVKVNENWFIDSL